jgi:ABC-2 type transport system permease protein
MKAPLWRLVAAREVTTRLRDKTFLVSTAVLLLLVLGGIVLSSVVGGRPPAFDVAVTGQSGARLAAGSETQLRALSGEDDARVRVRRLPGAGPAREAVQGERVDAALLPGADGFTLLARDEVPADLSAAVRSALSQATLRANAERAGTTVRELIRGSTLTEDTVRAPDLSSGASGGIAFVMALLFFVTAMGFGISIAQSVVVEKENRIVEILAAAVPLRALLWGKVLGNSLLALAQVLSVAVVSTIALAVVRDDALDVLPTVGVGGAWFLAFFLVGFLALASLWSVAGSLATRQDDLQATTAPGQGLLLIPYLVAVAGGERAVEIASFVPIASSMTMPGRMVDGDVPLWQPTVSLLVAIGTAALLIRLGARWYERTLLQTSRRVSYRELVRGAGSDA